MGVTLRSTGEAADWHTRGKRVCPQKRIAALAWLELVPNPPENIFVGQLCRSLCRIECSKSIGTPGLLRWPRASLDAKFLCGESWKFQISVARTVFTAGCAGTIVLFPGTARSPSN